MDAALAQILLGIVSNALTGVVEKSWSSATDTTLETAIDEASQSLQASEPIVDQIGEGPLEAFLGSPEAAAAVRLLFVAKVHGSEDTTEEIAASFVDAFNRSIPGADPGSGSQLFAILVTATERALDLAARDGNPEAGEAMEAVRFRRLDEELAGLRASLDEIKKADEPDLLGYEEWEKHYRNSVLSRHGTITPPSLDAFKQVPVDDIYVEPTFHIVGSDGSERHLSSEQIAERLDRFVVLGDPGAGKSTFALKLAYDLARGKVHVPGGALTPFIVNLKDYGAEKERDKVSIIEWIETIANSDYQVPPPEGAIKYLLASGRAIVIFDGLDELLDTSHRRQITSDIETFAARFVAAPLLVTSRRVGYAQAPLDQRRFSIFRLAELNEEQIERYANVWFDLRTELPKRDREQMAQDFLEDSQEAADDLRANTLMLGLLCNLYRGEGHIPRHRPQVYEKCAVMLFERWDKGRRIFVQLEFERHLRPAMRHLAYWIYSEPSLRGGVTEKELIRSAADFLMGRRFTDIDDARAEACRFVEFCRGRAWVFTDTGTTAAGEKLYQFTHRTFLEFFAAEHLVRTCRTPKDLAKMLRPHIAAGEWDVVAQLAFQLQDDNLDGAGDELLTDLLRHAEGDQRDVLLNFAARSLAFLVPNRDVCREVARAVTRRTCEWLLEEWPNQEDSGSPPESHSALVLADRENFDPVAEALEEEALAFAKSDSSAGRADAALEASVNAAEAIRDKREASERWTGRQLSAFNELWPVLEEHVAATDAIGYDAFLFGRLSLKELAAAREPRILFDGVSYRLYGSYSRSNLSQMLLFGQIGDLTKRDGSPLGEVQELAELGELVSPLKAPWSQRDILHVGFGRFLKDAPATPRDLHLEGSALFGAFAILAVMVERAQAGGDLSDLFDGLAISKGWMKQLEPWMLQRAGMGEGDAEELPVDPELSDAINRWSRSEWSAVPEPQRSAKEEH